MSKTFNEIYKKLSTLYEDTINSAQILQKLKYNADIALSSVIKYKRTILSKIQILKDTYGSTLKSYANEYNK